MASAIDSNNGTVSANVNSSSSGSASSRKRTREALDEVPQILVTVPKPRYSLEMDLPSNHFEDNSRQDSFQPKVEAENRVEHMVSKRKMGEGGDQYSIPYHPYTDQLTIRFPFSIIAILLINCGWTHKHKSILLVMGNNLTQYNLVRIPRICFVTACRCMYTCFSSFIHSCVNCAL